MRRRIAVFVSINALVTLVAASGGPGAAATQRVGPHATPSAILKVRSAGAGTITSSPAGINCPASAQPCEASFPLGTTVTLTARGDAGTPGWTWHVWDTAGQCANADSAVCTIRLDRSFTEVAAVFVGINFGGPRIVARWRGTALIGNLVVNGSTSHATNIGATLIAPSGRQRAYQSTIAAPGGAFTRTFPLPRTGFPPGTYTLRLDSFVTGRQMVAQSYRVTIPASPFGFVERAWVSSVANRRPVRRLRRGTPGATAHFVFSQRPRASARITTSWIARGRRLAPVAKAPAQEIESSLVILPGGLPSGRYTCVLRVGGVILARASIRIG